MKGRKEELKVILEKKIDENFSKAKTKILFDFDKDPSKIGGNKMVFFDIKCEEISNLLNDLGDYSC